MPFLTMTEEEKQLEKKLMPWRFWFLVVFSLLLIVTFVYYLPLRFRHSVMEHGAEESGMHTGAAEENG